MEASRERTEQLRFNPLKFERKRALEFIRGEAERNGLQVDAVKEKRRRLSVELDVTVTGGSDDILAFCRATGGTAEHDPPSRLRRWLDAVSNVRFDGGPY